MVLWLCLTYVAWANKKYINPIFNLHFVDNFLLFIYMFLRYVWELDLIQWNYILNHIRKCYSQCFSGLAPSVLKRGTRRQRIASNCTKTLIYKIRVGSSKRRPMWSFPKDHNSISKYIILLSLYLKSLTDINFLLKYFVRLDIFSSKATLQANHVGMSVNYSPSQSSPCYTPLILRSLFLLFLLLSILLFS